MQVFCPVEVHARGPVVAGAMLWRFQGTLHLTAIVKASFAIAPDGALSPATPEDLRPERDRIPFRPRADVVIEGGPRAYGGLLRLAVRRDDRTLIDKTIRVAGDPNAASLALDRVARTWADRSQPVPEIAADVDWISFQAAPADQQTEFLRGDEWILVEGLHPTIPRIVARLPGVRAEGIVYGALAEDGPMERPIELDADTLAIDPVRLVCSVTWRAAMPVADERELSRLRLALGIAVHDRPSLEPKPTSARRPAPASLEGTLSLTSEEVEQSMREARALPFGGHDGGSPAPPSGPASAAAPIAVPLRPPPHALEGTLDLSNVLRAASPAPAWLAPPSKPLAPVPRPSEETIQLGADALTSRNPAPFPIAPPSDPMPSSGAPMPGAPWAPPTIASVPRPASAFEGTLDLTPAPAAALVPDPVAAPLTARTPAPPVHVEPEPADAPPPAPPPKRRPPPTPDLNQGVYSRFTAKKR